MKEKKDTVKYLLIFITFVLFFAMLILCGMYINLRINGISSTLPEVPGDDKWVVTGTGYNSNASTLNLVSPTFIGYKNSSDGMVAAAFDNEARAELNDKYRKIITELLKGKQSKRKFANQNELIQFIDEIKKSDKFIYVNYYNEIPSSAILTDFSDLESIYKHDSFLIKYVFILENDNRNIYGVCINENLEVYLLESEYELLYDQNIQLAYNGVRGFVPFEFASFTYPEAVFTKSFEADSVMMVPSASFYEFDPDGDNTKELLDNLGFNRNLVKSFRSADNTGISFVDDGRELYVDAINSKMSYDCHNRGIHLSEYLKYDPKGENYGLGDILMCAKRFVNSLDRLLIGGEAYPALTGVYTDGEKVSVNFKYFYNGILITKEPYDLKIEFASDSVVGMEINAVFCDSGRYTDPVIPQKLAMTATDKNDMPENTPIYYNALYVTGTGADSEVAWISRESGGEN